MVRQHPNTVLLSPAAIAIKLPKLAHVFRDDDTATEMFRSFASRISFLMSASVTVGFVLVIDEHSGLNRRTARIAVRQDEVTVSR